LNVPVLVHAPESSPGLFPGPSDATGQAALQELVRVLERVFSEEFGKISREFLSAEFHAQGGDVCRVGSAAVCAAVEQPLSAALRRAQELTGKRLEIVHRWVNFHGLFDLTSRSAYSDADL
jgi:hypothetical protein